MERYSGRQRDLITLLALLDKSEDTIDTKLLIASIKFETTRDLLDKILNQVEENEKEQQ